MGQGSGSAYVVVEADERESLADLTRLRADWSATLGYTDADSAGFAERMREWWERQAGHRRAWLVRDTGGHAVAMANVMVFERMPRPGLEPVRWAYAANVWVDPDHRRQGVATVLMEHVLDWCREEGMVRVVLAPSEESRALYAGLGFTTGDDTLAVLSLR